MVRILAECYVRGRSSETGVMRRSFLASPLSAVAMLLMLQGVALARSPTPTPQAITDDAEGDNSAPTIIATGWDMSRRITLPIHIDGKGPFNFVVDTGSDDRKSKRLRLGK